MKKIYYLFIVSLICSSVFAEDTITQASELTNLTEENISTDDLNKEIAKNASLSKPNKPSENTNECGICEQQPIEPCCCYDPCNNIGLSLTFKPAYFWPQDSVYRDIYKGGYMSLFELCYKISHGIGFWTEVGYFHKNEYVTSVNIVSPTSVTQVPLSLGLNYTYCAASWLDIYFKIGPNWLYTKTWVDIPGLQKTVVKNTFGGTFGLGGKIDLTCGWNLELFVNYLYDRKEIKSDNNNYFKSYKIYLGGIQTGVGLGYNF